MKELYAPPLVAVALDGGVKVLAGGLGLSVHEHRMDLEGKIGIVTVRTQCRRLLVNTGSFGLMERANQIFLTFAEIECFEMFNKNFRMRQVVFWSGWLP